MAQSSYQRSTGGLVGALVVTLLVIGAFVAFRALNRDELETRPASVDYREQAGLAQDAGLDVVYPRELPEGWQATSVQAVPGERPVWGISLLTDEQRYIGIRREDDQLDDLLATYVDEDVQSRPDVRVAGSVAKDWQVFTDDGGDLAYAAQLGDEVVLVYGSAGEEDLRLVLERLTAEPVGSTG
ncbi:MAG TPA: DUF4245 family protein [Nocardioides sp.]|nr:DUF4245 family protein [Nocardioides sp.]